MISDLIAMYWKQQNSKPKMPTEGLVFWASLNGKTPNVAETGQALTKVGDITYGMHQGVPCIINWGSSAYIAFNDTGLPSGSTARTMSFWSDGRAMLGYGTPSAGKVSYLYTNVATGTSVGFNTSSYNVSFANPLVQGRMQHVCITVNGRSVTLFVDGVAHSAQSLSNTPNTVLSFGRIGRYANNNDYYHGYMAAARIYNRILTRDEITTLSKEFTTTP